MAGQVESALSAQMHGVVHESLQGEEENGPGLAVATPAGFWHRAAIHAADDAFEPAAGDIVVDGLGVDAPGL